MNLPNRITIARIIMMPVVVFFVLEPYPWHVFTVGGAVLTERELFATVMFLIATLSDGVDGYIARSRNMITNFGKFMDPLADKVLISSVLIALVEIHQVPAWIAIVILTRELAVTGLRLVASDEGIVIAAGKLGKWKTRLQVVSITAILIDNFPFSYLHVPFATIMLHLAMSMTLVSGADYFVKNRHVFSGIR